MLRDFAALLVSVGTLILVPSCMRGEVLAAGTRFEARLSTPTGSRISHPGDPIEATIIAPVLAGGRLAIPQGAIVSGLVQQVERLGLGVKHLTSGIEYRFDTVHLPDGTRIAVQAHVVQVETAKERVNDQGVVGGIYPTANLSSTAAFYVLPLLYLDPEFGVPLLGIKSLIARSPDPEIYFPPGTEMILQLTAAAHVNSPGALHNDIAPLSAAEMAGSNEVLAKFPQQRTDRGRNHPSDLINILFLGTRDSLNRAFQAAGWSGAQRSSLRSIYRMYHCMVQRMGYSMAPMGKLTLNGVTADFEYQKGLNTFSKRHHVRLWKQGQEDAWLGAATEDVGYKLRRMHLTHATDPLIDNERAKVLNDLAFTGCLDAGTLMTRDSFDPRSDQEEFAIKTDRKVAVLRMNDCLNPRTTAIEPSKNGVQSRRRCVQVLMALRNDLIRINPLSLACSTVRALEHRQRSTVNGSMSAFSSKEGKAGSSERNIQPAWIRPSVLDARVTTTDSQR
ncbi:MAG: LssY C-terminal domain-containing protein [Bryobacteraceae bacterium]